MANKFQVKRTTVSGRTPNTTNSGNSRYIDTGELALNLPDGKMFSSNGSVYFEVGANLINSNISGNLTVAAIIANSSIGTSGQVLTTNATGVYWATPSINTSATYSFSNVHTHTDNVIVTGSTLTVNGSGGNAVHSDAGITLSDTGSRVTYLGATYSSFGGTTTYPNTIVFVQTANPGQPQLLMTRGDLTTTNTSYKANQILMQSAQAGGNTKNVYITTTGILQQSNVGLDSYGDYYTTFQGARWRGANISGQIFLTSDQSLMSPAATNQIAFVVSGNTSGNVALDVQTDLKISRGLVANSSYGTAGQVLTSTGSGNVYWATSTSATGVNTDAQYAFTNVITFTANVVFGNSTVNARATSTSFALANSTATVTANTTGFFAGANVYANLTTLYTSGNLSTKAIVANGSVGTAGQILASNGTGIYWTTTQESVNATAVTTSSLTANAIAITSGTLSVGNSTVNTDIGNNYVSVGNSTSFVNTYSSYIQIGNTGTSAIVNSTTFTGTSNNTSFVGSVSAANVVSNAQLSANLANYATLSGATFTGNVSVSSGNLTVKGIIANGSLGTAGQILASNGTSVYWTADQGAVNATSVTANAVTTATLQANSIAISSGTMTVGNSTVNTDIGNNYISVGNSTSFANVYSSYIQIGNTVANATINSTVYTGTSNNTSFVGSVSAANVVSNAQLSSNLGNYAALAGATFTGNLNVQGTTNVVGLNVTGNLNVTGTQTIFNVTNLSVNDSIIILGSNNTGDVLDIGFVGHYANATTNLHAGVVRDASDKKFYVFDSYTTEPTDNNVNVAAVNTAVMVVGQLQVGNSTSANVYANTTALYVGGAIVNSTAYSGTANNATYLNNVAASSYVNTTGDYTISGIHTHTGNVVVNGALIANGSAGSSGQLLVSNGSSVYWTTDTSTGTVTANNVSSQTVTANVISGENLTINQGISVGNTTVNTSINATAIFSGNATSNSLVSPTQIKAANTTSNSTIDPSTIFVGNSVTNAVVSINQIDTTVSNIVSFQVGYNSGGALLINTSTAHGLSNAALDYFGSSVAVVSNTHPWIDGILFNYAPLYTSSNTIGYTWDSSKVPNNALKIASLVRTSGNVVLTTVGPHFANTSVFPSGFQSKFSGISAPPAGIINSNSVQLLNVINTTAFWYNTPSTPYKALTIDQISVVGGVYPYSGSVSAPVMLSSLPNAVVTSSGMVVFFVRTTTAHGLSNGSSVIIQGITNTPIKIGTISISWNGTYKAWTTHSSANSTYFGLIAFPKSTTLRSVPTLVSATSPTGTPLAVQNPDVSYTPPVPAYIVPLTGTITATGPDASVKQTDPVILQVANNVTRVRITPRNIFVGNTSGGTYSLISQSGIVAAKRGSFLASSVNGDGIKVESLVDDLSTADADATFFFANATVSQVGNSTVGSVITSNTISTSKFITTSLDNDTINTTMTPDGITINITEDTTSVNTYIAAKSASFAGSAEIAGALILGSTVLANGSAGEAGQILTSSNTGNVYWSTSPTVTGGGGDLIMLEMSGSMTANYSVTASRNALSIGPFSIANGVTATVPSGQRWLIL